MKEKAYKKSENCNLLTIREMSEEFNMGTSTIDSLAKRIGAKVKIGYMVRYKRDIFQNFIDSMPCEPTDIFPVDDSFGTRIRAAVGVN